MRKLFDFETCDFMFTCLYIIINITWYLTVWLILIRFGVGKSCHELRRQDLKFGELTWIVENIFKKAFRHKACQWYKGE